MADRPPASNVLPEGVYAAGRCLHYGSGSGPGRPGRGPWRSGLRVPTAKGGDGESWRCEVVATDRVNFLFADARALYVDTLEMLD